VVSACVSDGASLDIVFKGSDHVLALLGVLRDHLVVFLPHRVALIIELVLLFDLLDI